MLDYEILNGSIIILVYIRNFYTGLLFVIGLFISENTVSANQPDSLLNGLRIEGKVHYGFVLPHTSAIQYLILNNISGAEITVSTQSNGRHAWEFLYRYPRYGIGYNYNDFRNKEVLGVAHSFFGYIDIPFYYSKTRFSLNYQVGFGLSYFPQRYHYTENPLNFAISSPVNYYVAFDVIGRLKINTTNELKAAIELTHYSNGKTKSPNFGLNNMTFSAAWLHSLVPEYELSTKDYTELPFKYHILELFVNAGGKRDDKLTDNIYLITSFVADYNYSFSPKYSFGGGLDFFYDATLGITKEDRDEGIANPEDFYQAGLHLGLRARYNRLHVVFHAGHYLYATYLKYSPFYSRVGMRYAITENIILNFTLKSHLAIADFLEWGIGYRFNTKGI